MADHLPVHRFKNASALRMLLAAGLLAPLSMLSGCGDSPVSSANKTASDNANKAARIFASAGDYRPKENAPQITQPVEAAELNALKKRAADHPADYIKLERSIDKDLDTAAALLSPTASAIAPVQAVTNIEKGYINSSQASRKLSELQSYLLEAQSGTDALQGTVTDMAALGDRIKLLDARKTGLTKDINDKVKDAQAKYDELTKTLADKQSALDALNHQVDEKHQAADDLNKKAQDEAQAAAQTKADYRKKFLAAKSREELSQLVSDSLKADNHVQDLLSQSNDAQNDATNLQAQVQAATHDRDLAKIQLEEADATLKTFMSSAANANKLADEVTAAITALDDDKKKLTDALAEQSGKLKKALDDLDGGISSVAASSDAARTSFKNGLDQIHTTASDASALLSAGTGDRRDPAIFVATDGAPEAFVTLNQAVALYRKGQVHLLAAAASGLRDAANKSITAGIAALNVSIPAEVTPAAPSPVDHKGEAAKAFADAAALVKSITPKIKTSAFPDYPSSSMNAKFALAWIVPFLEASIDKASAAVAVDDATAQKFTEASKAAAAEAQKGNPFLSFAPEDLPAAANQ